MKINSKYIKVFLYLFLIYTLFFIICGFLAPILAHNKLYYMADLVYLLMHKSCAQEALRCFWILGYQMAICARCLGAYIGVAIGIIFLLFGKCFNNKIYISLILIAFGEILLEFLKIYNGNNYIRFFAGTALGFFIIISINYLLNTIQKGKRKICLKEV